MDNSNDSERQNNFGDISSCSVRKESPLVLETVKEKKVILIAIALDQNSGSEPGTGWLALKCHILLGNDVTVVTVPAVIHKFEFDLTFHSSKIRFIPVESKFLRLIAKTPFFTEQLYSLLWNITSKKMITNLLHIEKFDLIHHITYTGDWNYSALHSIKTSIPRIWGPIGSAERINTSTILRSNLSGFSRQFVKFQIENILRSNLRRIVLKKEIKVLAQNNATQNFFSKKMECRLMPMIALPHLDSKMKWNSPNSKYFFGSGRMIKFKNWKLSIEALSFLPNDFFLILAGDGPELERLKKYSANIGLENRVIFPGQLPHNECLNLLRNSKAFVFPSYGDSLGWSLGEAIHFGVPVVSLLTAASETLTKELSIDLIEPGSKLAQKFAQQMLTPTPHNGFNRFCLCRLLNEFETVINV